MVGALINLVVVPEPIARVVRVLLIVILALVIIFALLGLLPGGSGYSFRLLR